MSFDTRLETALIIEGLLDHIQRHFGDHVDSDQIQRAMQKPALAIKLVYGVYKGIIDDVDEPGADEKVMGLKPVSAVKDKKRAAAEEQMEFPGVSEEARILLSKKSSWRMKTSHKIMVDHGKDFDPQLLAGAAEQWVAENSQFDPSPNKQYMRYLAKQAAMGQIALPEDGPQFKGVLEIFMTKRGDWPGEQDVFTYDSWRHLQKQAEEYSDAGGGQSKSYRSQMTALRAMASEGTDIIVDMDVTTTSGVKNYKIFMCDNWAAASIYGKGAQWCTTASMFRNRQLSGKSLVEDLASLMSDKYGGLMKDAGTSLVGTPWEGRTVDDFMAEIYDLNGWPIGKPPEEIKVSQYKAPNPYFISAITTAKSYLKSGPLFIIYKDNDPYMQMTGDGGELRNVEDVMISRISPALSAVLIRSIQSKKMPKAFEDAVVPQIRRSLKKKDSS